jgi:hypothetical protein
MAAGRPDPDSTVPLMWFDEVAEVPRKVPVPLSLFPPPAAELPALHLERWYVSCRTAAAVLTLGLQHAAVPAPAGHGRLLRGAAAQSERDPYRAAHGHHHLCVHVDLDSGRCTDARVWQRSTMWSTGLVLAVWLLLLLLTAAV